jgi:hypothetical protein
MKIISAVSVCHCTSDYQMATISYFKTCFRAEYIYYLWLPHTRVYPKYSGLKL